MSAPNPGPGDVSSHELQDISESVTPSTSLKDVTDTASSKNFQSANPADVPLSTSTKTLEPSAATTEHEPSGPTHSSESEQTASGGGLFGVVRSIFGGSSPSATQGSDTAVSEAPQSKAEVTHETKLTSGTEAQVATAPGHSAVPETLQKQPSPVGTATTTFTEPVSEFAPALAGIAGEPEPSDPTKKYGHALDALTGDSPVASSPGLVTTVTEAASSAVASTVETVKHAVGYETHDTVTETPNTAAADSPGTITYEELPKAGRVHPHEDGSVDVGAGEASSLAARRAEGTPAGAAQLTGASTTGPVTNVDQEVPKSATVNAPGDGTAEIDSAPKSGLIASAVGTVAGGAQVLKESVAGLVGYNQAGDTSEQIAALDEQDAASTNPAVVSESAASGAKAPVAYESEGADPKTAGGGPYPQSGTRNEAGPVVQEKPEGSATTARDQISGTASVPGHAGLPQGSSSASQAAEPASSAAAKSSTTGSGVKEVEPVASNGTTESTKSGKENVRLPTGDVVEADKPDATGSKAAISSPSSKPVVSAFAKKSTEAPRSSTEGGADTSAAKPTSQTTSTATPASKPEIAAEGAAAEKATGAADKAKGATTGVSGGASDAKANAATAQGAKTDAAETAANKEEKKDKQSCGCCTIS